MKAYLKKYKWALCLLVIFAALCWVYKTHYSTKSYPTVLTYHAIEEKLPEETSEENEYLFVRPADLEEQLQLLTRKGYEFCFASQYEITNKKQVILTLDDGYEDNYTNLFPLLKKYQAKATISVVTGSIGQPGILTADQIREMSDSGLVEFASHTVTHPHLTSLDDAALDQELQASKHALEEITGKDVQATVIMTSGSARRRRNITASAISTGRKITTPNMRSAAPLCAGISRSSSLRRCYTELGSGALSGGSAGASPGAASGASSDAAYWARHCWHRVRQLSMARWGARIFARLPKLMIQL